MTLGRRQPLISIKQVAHYLPAKVVTNSDLEAEHPDWDMSHVEQRSGVLSRHIAGKSETALDLSVHACRSLFESQPDLMGRVDGIIYCTQSPDYQMPPNSCVLHRDLRLSSDVLALDINLACSGYIYGLALAEGLVAAGRCGNILLVTADTYSKFIHPGDRASRTLFGDGAAVSWVSRSEDSSGVIDLVCQTSGEGFESIYIPAGGFRNPRSAESAAEKVDKSGNVRTAENFFMDGVAVLSFVTSNVPQQIRALLARNALDLSEIDLAIFHQASKLVLGSLGRLLKLPEDRVFNNLATVGNTVSSSIPIALSQAQELGLTRPGMKVLLSGFGVGLSWASAVVQL